MAHTDIPRLLNLGIPSIVIFTYVWGSNQPRIGIARSPHLRRLEDSRMPVRMQD
jgi:hypothetical protein